MKAMLGDILDGILIEGTIHEKLMKRNTSLF